MSIEDIQILFSQDKEYPISSSDCWQLFQYPNHTKFKRAIDKEKNYSELYFTYEQKVISKRSSNVIYLSRKLFFELCCKKNFLKNEVEAIFLKWHESQLRKKYLRFEYSKKVRTYEHTGYGVKIRGHFYIQSLNTYDLANDIGLCPFELFAFSAKFIQRFGVYQVTRFANQFDDQKLTIPMMKFDSDKHLTRHYFLTLVGHVQKKYKLNNFQKKLIIIYKDIIEELIFKQASYDEKVGRIKSKKKDVDKRVSNEEMKKLFRKGAMIYHPDKGEQSGKKFIKLKKAYDNGNYLTLKKMVEG